MLISFLGILASVQALAQQRMQYSQYLLNPYLTNPALGGVENYIDLRAGYSNQWTGFPGSPKGAYLTLHSILNKSTSSPQAIFGSLPLRGRSARLLETHSRKGNKLPLASGDGPKMRHAIGLSGFTEHTGPLSTSGVSASYSIHFALTNWLRLSLGTGIGLGIYSLNTDKIDFLDPNDPVVTSARFTSLMPDVNAGLMLYSRQFFVGASVKQLIQNELNSSANTNQNDARQILHWFVNGGCRFRIAPDVTLTPSVMFRYASYSLFSIDGSLNLDYQDLLFGSITYRHNDAVVGLVGVVIKKAMVVSYAYDFTTSNLRTQSNGTHSINLGFRLARKGRLQATEFFWH